jgi:hypothetical protein
VKLLQITPKVRVGRGSVARSAGVGTVLLRNFAFGASTPWKNSREPRPDPRRFIDLTILDELEKEGFLKTLYMH